MYLSRKLLNLKLFALLFTITSCSTIDSTWDSISESVESAGDYLYDSVNFWEDDEEPEQSDAVIIEEAVEVPEFALPDEGYFDQNQDMYEMGQSQEFSQPAPTQYFNPIYRSQRQYYFVGPNGTPMPAPPPPPFPQYSIEQRPVAPYSYNNNLGYPPPPARYIEQQQKIQKNYSPRISAPAPLTKDEEMELFGIQNNCIRVKEDYVNGGYMCDDFD